MILLRHDVCQGYWLFIYICFDIVHVNKRYIKCESIAHLRILLPRAQSICAANRASPAKLCHAVMFFKPRWKLSTYQVMRIGINIVSSTEVSFLWNNVLFQLLLSIQLYNTCSWPDDRASSRCNIWWQCLKRSSDIIKDQSMYNVPQNRKSWACTYAHQN